MHLLYQIPARAGLPSNVRSRSGQRCSLCRAGDLRVLRPTWRIHIRLRGRVLHNSPPPASVRPAAAPTVTAHGTLGSWANGACARLSLRGKHLASTRLRGSAKGLSGYGVSPELSPLTGDSAALCAEHYHHNTAFPPLKIYARGWASLMKARPNRPTAVLPHAIQPPPALSLNCVNRIEPFVLARLRHNS